MTKALEFFKNLESIEKFKKLDKDNEPESWKLALFLDELEKFSKKNADILKKIQKAKNEEAIMELLWGLGEDIRHFLYHLNECNFFDTYKES